MSIYEKRKRKHIYIDSRLMAADGLEVTLRLVGKLPPSHARPVMWYHLGIILQPQVLCVYNLFFHEKGNY